MAFKRVKSLDGASDPYQYYQMTSNEGCTIKQLLNLSGGYLTNAGATATTSPQFVAQATVAASTETTRAYVPVIKITEQQEYETTSTATVAATLAGSVVTLSTNGLQCTATTASGVFEISYSDGSTSSTYSKVRGYFKRS